jgi:hypothetical protein
MKCMKSTAASSLALSEIVRITANGMPAQNTLAPPLRLPFPLPVNRAIRLSGLNLRQFAIN